MKYRSNRNTVYSCKYHIIWCCKYRRKVLVGDVAIRLRTLIVQCSKQGNFDVVSVEIMPDHVHLLVGTSPQLNISKAVKAIKGVSSHILRDEFPFLKVSMPTLWTNSYFVSTVGGATLDEIKKYVENQKCSERRKVRDNSAN